MSVSRTCEDCFTVKRCNAYAGRDGSALVYLCRPCARALGYVPKSRRRPLNAHTQQPPVGWGGIDDTAS
jgi:hypothetical protein